MKLRGITEKGSRALVLGLVLMMAVPPSSFDIDSALNLDGGAEAQLYIKTKDFEFYSPPSWQSRLGNIMDQPKFWLPTVIGVFPRPQ